MNETTLVEEIELLSKNLKKYGEAFNNINEVDNIESAQKNLLKKNLNLKDDFFTDLKTLNKALSNFDESLSDISTTSNAVSNDIFEFLINITGKTSADIGRFVKFRYFHQKISMIITGIVFFPWLYVVFYKLPTGIVFDKFFKIIGMPLDYISGLGKSSVFPEWFWGIIGLVIGLPICLVGIVIGVIAIAYICFFPFLVSEKFEKFIFKLNSKSS